MIGGPELPLGFAFTIAIGSPLLDKIDGPLAWPFGRMLHCWNIDVMFAGAIAQGAAVYNVI
jgi:hypothetical protein